MRDGAAFVDVHAAGAAAFEELEAQAALAGARLGDHADHLPVARGRLREASSSVRRSAARPTKRERPRAREMSKRVRAAPMPVEPVDAHRLGDALDAELAEILEREVAADQRRGRRGQVAGVGRGERFHALREADRVALRRVVHAQVVADPADHDRRPS